MGFDDVYSTLKKCNFVPKQLVTITCFQQPNMTTMFINHLPCNYYMYLS